MMALIKKIALVFFINFVSLLHLYGQDLASDSTQSSGNEINNILNQLNLVRGDISDYRLFLSVIILLLSAVLLFIGIIRKKRANEPLEGILHFTNLSIFSIAAILEIVYMAGMGSDATWFCQPQEVGWVWTIVNFIIFTTVVSNQAFCFLSTLEDLQYNSYAKFSWKIGLFSWPAALVAIIILSEVYEPAMLYVLILLGILQVYQIALIFYRVIPKGGFLHALLCSIFYLIGAVATISMLIHFFVLLIIALIAYIFLTFFTASGGGTAITTVNRFCPVCGRPLDASGHCGYENSH